MKRIFQFAAILIAFVMATPLVLADASPDDCYSLSFKTQIEGCTKIIENPASSGQERSVAYALRGQALSILKRYAEGMADLDKSIEINPDSAYALNSRAWAWFKWKRNTNGLADVEKSIRLDPGAHPTWDTRGHLRQLLGDFDGAFSDYETAIGLGGVPVIRMYQCGLSERGLYKGKIDGLYTSKTREALKTCSFLRTCDPLPENLYFITEDMNCDNQTS